VPKILLTELRIKSLLLPPSGTETYWDTSTRGLGIRVSQGGAKTFIALIDSGRRQAIGRYPILSLKDARTECLRILAEKTLGHIRPMHTAFDDAKTQFLQACEERNRPRTVKDYRRHLDKHFPFGRTSVGDIKPQDIIKRLAKLRSAPSERHHAFTTARAFFAWCEKQHFIATSPMAKLEVPPANPPRERVLTDPELSAILSICIPGKETFHHIVALLFLTGQRKGEIAHLQWDWIDQEERLIHLPSSLTKNKRAHTFPYGELAAQVFARIPKIDSPYVFPAMREQRRGKPATVFNGFGKPKERLDRQAARLCPIEPWTLHDARRTLSSGMASMFISQTTVEKLLNHVSGGTLSPIAQVYNRYTYIKEMRAAVHAWEKHVEALASKH